MTNDELRVLCETFPTSAPYMIERARPLTDAQENRIEEIAAMTADFEVIGLHIDGTRVVSVETVEMTVWVEIYPDGKVASIEPPPPPGVAAAIEEIVTNDIREIARWN